MHEHLEASNSDNYDNTKHNDLINRYEVSYGKKNDNNNCGYQKSQRGETMSIRIELLHFPPPFAVYFYYNTNTI